MVSGGSYFRGAARALLPHDVGKIRSVGDISAESEGEGIGATIIITLPNKIVDLEGKNLSNINKNYNESWDVL